MTRTIHPQNLGSGQTCMPPRYCVLSRSFPLALLAWCLAALPGIAESPYTAWAEDYTGLEPNTVLLWKFDEPQTGLDSSGNGYDISFSREGVETGISGKFGQGFLSVSPKSATSDLNEGYAQSAASIPALPGNAVSIEFWYQPFANEPTEGQGISYFFDKKYTDAAGAQLLLSSLDGTSNSMQWVVGNGSRSAVVATGSLVWEAERWYHVAATYENRSGDGVLRIFRDGELLTESIEPDFGDLATGERFFRLANRLGSLYGPVPGTYDNFRISEIAYDYAPFEQ